VNEWCVDASVAVKWAVKGEPFRSKALRLLAECGTKGIRLIAPPFFSSETDSVIRRRVFEGKLPPSEENKAYAALDRAPVQVLDMPELRERAREIARQFRQRNVYDSVYAALAELRGCDLWTADKQFYDAVKDKLKFVKFLPDYP